MAFNHSMPKEYRVYKIVSYVAGGLVLAVVVALLFGFIVKWLWNAALAPTFGINPITFWQAVGLFVLAKLFFGFGGGTAGRSRGFRRRGEHAPNEDKAFRAYWRERGKTAYQAFLQEREQEKGDDNGRQGDRRDDDE